MRKRRSFLVLASIMAVVDGLLTGTRAVYVFLLKKNVCRGGVIHLPLIVVPAADLSKVSEIRNSMPVREHRRAGGPLFAQQLLEDSTDAEFGKPAL